MEQLSPLVNLLLGWLLGVLGPGIAERIRRHYHKRELTRTITGEIGELQLKLALSAWTLRSHLGEADATFVSWVRPIIESYPGRPEDPDLLERTRKVLAFPDEQVAAAVRAGRQDGTSPSVTPRVVPYSLPYFATQIAAVSVLPLDLQLRLWRVQDHLEAYNTLAARVSSYFERTFDSSLTAANRAAVIQNMESGYRDMVRRAEKAADAIGSILAEYGEAPANKRVWGDEAADGRTLAG